MVNSGAGGRAGWAVVVAEVVDGVLDFVGGT